MYYILYKINGKQFLPCLRDFQVMTYQYKVSYQEVFLTCLRDFQVITYQNKFPLRDWSSGITCIIIVWAISFLIGRKCTMKFRKQCLWHHVAANYTIIISRALKVMGNCVVYVTGLKVDDQLVTYVTRFLAVRLKKYVWSHHHALKAKV